MDTVLARRLLLWITLPAGAAVLGALGGAALGTLIGGHAGAPDGEGFEGFLWGLRIGAGAGLLAGCVGARWLQRRLERGPVSDPTSGG